MELLERLLYLGISREEYAAIKRDIVEENRRNVVIYSAILAGGMAIMLFLSLFIDVLVSSRIGYAVAIAVGIFLFLLARGPARKTGAITIFCQYVLIFLLMAFGIALGTIVEPARESTSFAILLFVAPLLFTGLPIRLNAVTLVSMLIYTVIARYTQSDDMFAFNMSVIMPYGLANLVLTHFTCKMKMERAVYAFEKKQMAEYDRLTGLLNRWSFEKDINNTKYSVDKEEIIGVCSFDINGLKKTNDTYGHKAGDELLIASARAISKIAGKYGRCYRIGGDEFMAILKDVFPGPEELIKMLNEETDRYQSSYGFAVTISGAMVKGAAKNIDELIAEADKQMYRHKSEYYLSDGMDRRKSC